PRSAASTAGPRSPSWRTPRASTAGGPRSGCRRWRSTWPTWPTTARPRRPRPRRPAADPAGPGAAGPRSGRGPGRLDVRLGRQAQHPLADDVALHLGGAAADRQRPGEEEAVVPDADGPAEGPAVGEHAVG